MSAGTDALIQAFRLWVTDNVPASGANWPNKLEIIAALQRLALDLSAGTAGFRPYANTAARDADTTAPAGTIGYVYNNNGSATDPANGFYQKVGSSWVVAAWFESLLQDYIGANLPYAGRAPIIFQNNGERNGIPMAKRYAGIMVWVEVEKRWYTLSADNLGAIGSDAGWHVPEWMVPLQQGTIAQRNNRIGTDPANPSHTGWPKAGMRFLQTDVEPNVQWELRLAGQFAGLNADSPVLTQPTWVTIPQASDLIKLEIASFDVVALGSGAEFQFEASWALDGITPTSQGLSWGSSSIALPPSARRFASKDWSAVKDLFVSGNSISDATDSPKYHTILAARMGVTSRFTARYSRDITQTHRAGLDEIRLTFADNSVPAGSTGKPILAINGNSPIVGTQAYAFLNIGDAGITTGCTMTGTLVDGAISRRGTASIPNGASVEYKFTLDAGEEAATFSGPVLFIPDIANYPAQSRNICGVGQNTFYSGVPGPNGDHTNPAVPLAVDRFAAAANGQPFLFLDILPNADWPADGTENIIDGVTYTWQCFSAMEATNVRNEQRHPGARARSLPTSGFPNGRTLLKYLQDAANPAFPGNTEDIAAGLTPREFRSDSLHLNLAGQTVTADFFEEAFQAQVIPAPVTADTVFTLTVSGVFENRGDFVTYQTTLSDVATATVRPGGSAFDAEAREMAEGSVKLGDAVSLLAETPEAKIMTALERDKVSTIARIQMTDGTEAFGLGWVTGDVFHVHTMFRPDLSIENVYLDAIRRKADLAPSTFLSGSEQHRFVVAVQDPTDAQKAYVLFGVRSDGSLDSPEYNQVLAEVLGNRAAVKQQLHGRKAAYGFGLFGLRKALLAARGGGSVDLVMPGDSLTTNIIHLTVRRLFGRLLGFGGPGMLPWHATGLGYDGTSGAITMNPGNWTFWTYNPTTSPNPPAGTNGWGLCWLKSGGSAVAGSGQSSMVFQAPYRDRPEYKFDTVRVFFFSAGGDASFRVRANTADGSSPGPWTTATANTAVAYVDVPGFGSATGRYRIDTEEQISGAGRLYIGAVCPFNSAGGIRFNRQSLGGYKAGDIAGQDGTAQAFYYANLPSGKPAAGSIHLAHNDSGTDDATYLANMRTIATRLRTANPDCSLTFTQWFSAAALKREAAIKSLAAQYDGTVFDVRDIIPSREWAAAKNLLQQPATPDDPHLVDDGYEHVGHSWAIHHGIQTATYNLQGY